MLQYLEVEQILLLTMACLCQEYLYQVCVLCMEMCWEKYFLIKDDTADKHTQNQQWTPRL